MSVPGGAGEGRPRSGQTVRLSLPEGTRAGVPSPREGDRFGKRAAGGLNGEGFRKGKVEGAGIGGRESREFPWGAKKGPRCKEKADGEEQTA